MSRDTQHTGNSAHRGYLQNLRRKFRRPKPGHIFPIIVISVALILSAFAISGTSTGVYDYLFGSSKENLLIGEPRSIRSDEWMVTTPFIIAQRAANYPVINENIGSGQDMTITIDVPYADWSIFFHPQNLAFFILPVEIAFALKWWFLAVVLMLAVYYFVLLLYPKRYLLASLLSLLFFVSPFIQWWYQSITLLPIAYGLGTMVVAVELLRSDSFRRKLLLSCALVYILSCFALIMYPAFQLTIALVVAVLFFAYLYAHNELKLLINRRNLLLIGSVGVLTLVIVAIFLLQHQASVQATLATVYPGARNILSGGLDPLKLLTWPLSYLLLTAGTAAALQNNQSELSGFMLYGFILLPFLLWLACRGKHGVNALNRQEKVLLWACVTLALLFALRMFVPIGSEVFNLLGFGNIPHIRLFIGIGVLNLVILAIAVGRTTKQRNDFWKALVAPRQLGLFVLMCLVYGALILFLDYHYSISFIGPLKIAATTLVFAAATSLLLSSHLMLRYTGLVMAIIIGVVSSAPVNPLYRGVSLDTNDFVSYVSTTQRNDTYYWIANDSSYLSSAILASGAEIAGGVNTYPQLAVWEKFFPNDEAIYNRYAHVRFRIDESSTTRQIELLQGDLFRVTLSSCDELLKSLRVGYIVSETDLGDSVSCFPSRAVRVFDQKELYIYSRTLENGE